MPAEFRISPRVLLCLGLVTLGVTGCARDQGRTNAAPTPSPGAVAAPTPAPSAEPPAHAMAAAEGGISGTVLETMDSGGYTYAKLDHAGTPVWAAGPATKLAVGTKVGNMNGTLMTGFRSETLSRTFDQIYFVSSFPVGGGTGVVTDPHAGAATAVAAANAPMTEKLAPAAGGKSIADVFAAKASLAGKPVVVRGKVVKVNNGILGRNWLHLQDGTGSTGTNDLLITTEATAAVGDVVVARGTLATDKDFGGGYRYDLVVENATLAAQ